MHLILTGENSIITGNLNYSSKQEIEIPNGSVTGEVKFSKYKSTSNEFAYYILELIAILIFVSLIYLLISKFMPKYIDKISNFTVLSMLKTFGIGILVLILTPIVSLFLLITVALSPIAILLMLLYILLLLLGAPIFIIAISAFIKSKIQKPINTLIIILLVTIILSLIELIPYVGFIISLLKTLIGLGILVKSVINK